MEISWLPLSLAVTAYLKKFAVSQGEKLLAKQADGLLARAFHKLVPDKRITEANEAFVSRFSKELDSSMDLSTVMSESYQKALERYLCNPSVQFALLAPLDGTSDLDPVLLEGIWSSIGVAGESALPPLPADFEWGKVTKRYQESIARQMLADPALRPILAALASMRTAEATERAAGALSRMAGVTKTFDLDRYREVVRSCFAHLVLGPLDADWTKYDRRVSLQNVYVPQVVKEALPPTDNMRDYVKRTPQLRSSETLEEYLGALRSGETRPRESESEPRIDAEEQLARKRSAEYAQVASIPLLEVVDEPANSRLVLLGDPGLGKSTLLKSLALKWTDEPSQRPLPLFVELRRAADHKDLLDFFEVGPLRTCCFPKVELDQYLKTKPTLLLFDGLDEVNEGRRGDVVAQIIGFIGEYPKSRAIVTTRIHGYSPGSAYPEQFADAGFRQFTLQDFDEPEIDRFLALWHRAAFDLESERIRYEGRVRDAIEESPAIRELAANPLLLTMMVILSRTQDLPRDRCKLYEKCSELLLRNWDLEKFPELKEKRDARDLKDKLGPDQKMRILEKVASAMQQERAGLEGNMISEESLKAIVSQELTQLGVDTAWVITEDLIWMLRERNFMLGFMGGKRYAFVHRTFLEYFCARDIKFRFERTSSLTLGDLCEFFRKHWRLEIWHEVLRLLCGIVGAEHAGACILQLVEQRHAPEGHRAVFLASQCLREIREVGCVSDVRARVRETLLELTDFQFSHYFESGDPEVLETIRIRMRSISEFARGWRDHPETMEWLTKWAGDGDRWASRYAALRELGREWRGEPQVFEMLRDHAVADGSPPVRQVAVQALARGWAGEPTTLPYLKEVASRDESPAVIRTVVAEVARVWKAAPETITWLLDCAGSGGDPALQRASLVMLRRYWKDDPRVRYLIDCVQWAPKQVDLGDLTDYSAWI